MTARNGGKYGVPHRTLRKRLARQVAAGGALCWRCGRPILPGEAWDLGHTDDGSGWAGPEHASCNRRHGGQLRAAQLYGRPRPQYGENAPRWSRHWFGTIYDARCADCRAFGSAYDAALERFDPEAQD